MKPLIVLLSAFVITLIATKIFKGKYELAFSGRVAMSVMLVFTSIAHFAFTNGMAMMLPSFIPYKTLVVYITGIIELAAAVGLLIPSLRIITGWLLIVFFLFLLPANIHAAFKNIDYQTGTYDGNGLMYLWFRVPLQLFFIVWVYLCAIKSENYNTKLNK